MARFLAYPLVRLVAIVAILAGLLKMVLHPLYAAGAGLAAISWVTATLALVVMISVERMATGRPPSAIGLNPRYVVRDLAGGLALGSAMFSGVVLVLALSGDYRVVTTHMTFDLAVAALVLIAGAVFEEVLFRGVLFRLVEESAGTWIALAFSAILFGLIHGLNPGATWFSSLAIALEAGVLLAAAFVVTRNLWFPIGVHFAWNFCEGPIYGTQVSGRDFLTSAIVPHVSGPMWMTGGPFGPEAGIPAIVIGVAVAIVLLVYAKRHALVVALRIRGILYG